MSEYLINLNIPNFKKMRSKELGRCGLPLMISSKNFKFSCKKQMHFLVILKAFLLLTVSASTLPTELYAQERHFLPLFDVYHSSNAFAGTSADKIFLNGIEIETPSALQPRPDKVVGGGAIWLNALQSDVASMSFSAAPFFWHQRFLDSGEQSTVYGASMIFGFSDMPQRHIDLRANLTRLEASWTTETIDDISLRLGYLQLSNTGAQFNIGVNAGRRWGAAEHPVSRLGIDTRYRTTADSLHVSFEARATVRISDAKEFSGHDAGIGLMLGRDFESGLSYIRIEREWSHDDSTIAGQPAPRRQTKNLAEVGYGWELDSLPIGRLTAYARHQRSRSNLALFESDTTVVGIGLRLEL